MQHLETTYFLNQAIWCVFMFIVMYVTIKKNITEKNTEILRKRKYIIEDYTYMSNKLLYLSSRIENKNEKLNRVKFNNIKKQEKLLENLIYKIKANNNIKNKDKKSINSRLNNIIKRDENINKKINELKKNNKIVFSI